MCVCPASAYMRVGELFVGSYGVESRTCGHQLYTRRHAVGKGALAAAGPTWTRVPVPVSLRWEGVYGVVAWVQSLECKAAALNLRLLCPYRSPQPPSTPTHCP